MKSYKSYVLLSLFSAEFVKTILQPATFVDAALLLVLGSVFAYVEYKNADKKLEEFEKKLSSQQTEINGLKEQVGSIKMVQSVRPGAINYKV